MLDVLGKPASLKVARRRAARPGRPAHRLDRRRPSGCSAGAPGRRSRTGLERTVEWYRENDGWWRGIRQERTQRLLVLGAGAGQLGLLEAARAARACSSIAVDRNPAAPGFRFADRRAIISVEDEPQIDRLAAAERVDGIIAPGHRLAGRDRRADRRAARAAAPDRPGDRRPRDLEAAPARAVRRGGRPAPAARRLRDAGGGARWPRRGSATRAWSRRPTARARRGSCSSASEGQLDGRVRARARRVAVERRPRRGARPRARGDGERVLGRRPLHAADRHRPGRRRAARLRRRARARLAELARAGRGRRRRSTPRGRRSRRSASATGRPTRRSSSASAGRTSSSSRPGSAAATTPSSARRCSASTSNELALSAALGEPVDASRSRAVAAARAAGASASSSRSPAIARGGRGRGRGRGASRASPGCAIYPEPGAVLGPLRRGSDRVGAVLAVGATPRGGGRARWPGGRLRTLRRCRCPRRSCRLDDARPSSASSRPRSATRRSPPSPRRSAPAG